MELPNMSKSKYELVDNVTKLSWNARNISFLNKRYFNQIEFTRTSYKM